MAWMQQALLGEDTRGALPSAPSPVPGVKHLVVSSHDIDFYWTTRAAALTRVVKNLGIAVRLYKSADYFAANARMLARVLGGGRVGDYLPALVEAGEKYKFRSTLFVVARGGHRRDPEYGLEQIGERLREAARQGFEIGVHGSYSSVIEEGSLAEEANELRRVTSAPVKGGRQHWLRFDRTENLFRQVSGAGLAFDSTLGFSEVAGFRNGASFAFPPYNFEKEAACEFLEIPLAIMDGNLEATARATGEDAGAIAEEILSASRRWGWGGISTLWHNPVEALSVPERINDVFWSAVGEQALHEEKWISGAEFLSCCIARYQDAGLMQSVRWRDA